MAKLYFSCELPDELIGALLQAIRDFDTRHDPHHEGGVHFNMLTESDWPTEKMQAVMMAISPPPAYCVVKKFDTCRRLSHAA